MRLRALCLVLVFGICARPAAAAPLVSIVPATGTFQVGETVSFDVVVANVLDLFSFQFDVAFDPTVFSAVPTADGFSSEGAFLKSGGDTFFIGGSVDAPQPGIIAATADSLLGDVSGVSGAGTLASFSLLVKGAKTDTALLLSNLFLIDSGLNELQGVGVSGASVTTTPEPATLLLMASGIATAWRVRSRKARASAAQAV